MRTPLLLLGVLAFSLPALALSGPTLGPPPPSAPNSPVPAVTSAPPLPKALAGDERLAQPVTLALRRTPVTRVLAELQRQTGVSLTAEREIAEEPAVVFMRERPAREVMHHLALLFRYTWRRHEDKGGATYELFQDQQAGRDEQALREAEERRLWDRLSVLVRHFQSLSSRAPGALQRAYQADQEAFDSYRKRYEAAAPQEKQRLWTEEGAEWRDFNVNWNAYASLSKSMPRALMRLIALIPPQGWDVLRGGGALYFDPQGAPTTLPMPANVARELAGATPDVDRPDAYLLNDLAALRDVWLKTEDRRVLVTVQRREENGELRLSLNMEPVVLRETSRARTYAGLARFTLTARQERPNPDSEALLAPDAWKTHRILGRKRPLKLTPPSDPWLRQDSSPTLPLLRIADAMAQLAEGYQADLIAEGYHSGDVAQRGQTLPSGRAEIPFYEALNRWVSPHSEWSLRGDVLHSRRRHWYEERLNEIPASVAARWAAHLRQKPALTLGDAASLLTLRDGQLGEFTGVMRERGIWLGELFEERLARSAELMDFLGVKEAPLLRAYAALSATQQARLRAGGRLRYTDMPRAARRQLVMMLARLDRHSPGAGPRPEPFGGELSLTTVSIQRTIRRVPRPDVWSIDYRMLPAENESEKELWKTYLSDAIPAAPGVREPSPGDAAGVRLTFRTQDAAYVGCVPLPWAGIRDL